MANYKVIGPPGTGKTRKLLSTVQKYIDNNMSLKNIGYFAFTRKQLTKLEIDFWQTM